MVTSVFATTQKVFKAEMVGCSFRGERSVGLLMGQQVKDGGKSLVFRKDPIFGLVILFSVALLYEVVYTSYRMNPCPTPEHIILAT